jgi:hypothetical protein
MSDRLVKSILGCDRPAVRCRLLLYPADANSRIVNRNLATPLHLACIFRPYDIVALFVQIYPQALLHQDTTLFFIRAGGPLAAGLQSKFLVGAPLHLACCHGSSTSIICALLAQGPAMVTRRTESGEYPATLALYAPCWLRDQPW